MEEENVEKDMTPILLKDLGMRYPIEKKQREKEIWAISMSILWKRV